LETVNEGKTIAMFNSNVRPTANGTTNIPYDEAIIKDEDGTIIPF